MVQAVMVVMIVLFIATAVVLARKYAITRDRGLLWLGVALVIWPLLISPLLNYGVGQGIDSCTQRGACFNLFPFTLVEQGVITVGELVLIFGYVNRIIGVALGLVAVMQLYRNVHRNGSTPQPVSATSGTSQNQKDDKGKPFATTA